MSARQVVQRYPEISLDDLKRDLRTGRAPYVPVGKGVKRQHRRMTDEQAQLYRRSKQVIPAAEPEPVDPLVEAVVATRRRQRRRTGHRQH